MTASYPTSVKTFSDAESYLDKIQTLQARMRETQEEITAIETALKGTVALATVTATKINTTGGVHVGGTSDAGTDNLVVDGTSTLTGAVTLGTTAITATGIEINNVCDIDTLQAMTDDGAISIKNGIVTLDKGSAIAATLAAPAATDNGKMLTIYSLTAQAHTVTITGSPAGTSDDVATWTNAIGNSLTLRAYGEKWYVVGCMGVDVA